MKNYNIGVVIMKQKEKRIIALILFLTWVITFCGCGKTDEGNVVKKFDDEETITLSMLTSKRLSDNFWTDNYTTSDGTNIKIAEYTADYYDKEKLTYREMVERRLESNVDIDMYIIHAEDVIDFDKKGYWLDLSDFKVVSSLSEDALAQSTYDGKVFSVPLSYTGFGFWWNVDILKKHGLSVPSNEAEFLNVCEKLKKAGIMPYIGNAGYALTVPAMAKGFSNLYSAKNSLELVLDLSSGKTPVSEYMTKGFQFVEMMIKKGYMDPEYALDTMPQEGDVEDFLAGKGAFICAPMDTKLESPDFEIMLTGIPILENGEISVVGANYRLAVNPKSPNLKYVKEFMDGLITPEWLANVVTTEYALSSGKGNYDLSYLNKNHQDFARLVIKGSQIPNQDFNLHFNTWECIRDISWEICKGISATEATKKYDKIQQKEIKLYSD